MVLSTFELSRSLCRDFVDLISNNKSGLNSSLSVLMLPQRYQSGLYDFSYQQNIDSEIFEQ